jgi:hypothetical protein
MATENPMFGDAFMVDSGEDDDVTEPPKIILYYRLSRSTWPLSNNKELLVASAG